LQNKTFKIGSLELPYVDHEYNHTKVNERTIEVALGYKFFELMIDHKEHQVEVGAVMPYYLDEVRHEVVDLFDPWAHCNRTDAVEFTYTGKNVLSISTIEHIATSDYGATPANPHLAFTCLDKIVKTAKNYLVTWPIGYNPTLDNDLLVSQIPFKIMARDIDNNWYDRWPAFINEKPNTRIGAVPFEEPFPPETIRLFKYSQPYTCGNAIVVITNIEDFLKWPGQK